jgi:GNAT superfamily N-acetyltransferase
MPSSSSSSSSPSSPSSLSVRAATPADIDAASVTLALAFANDPVWGGWAFPSVSDYDERVRRLTSFWRPNVKAAVAYSGLRMAPDCSAVALWVPPGVDEIDPENAAVLSEVVTDVCGDRGPLIEEGFEVFDRNHPPGDYWYLSLLATHPHHRGQGLGMALVADQLAWLDAQGIASYLESTNPVNLRRYGRAGFAPLGSFVLPKGPTVDTMWRDPQPTPRTASAGDS